MDMGDSDSDGGGFGVGILSDVGGGIGGFIVLIVFVGILIYCSMRQSEEQTEERLKFCTEVCGQYHDKPVVREEQCLCKDEQGIYDPDYPRMKNEPLAEKAQ